MKDSKIEWCDDTVNLWWGCTEVHAGCDNCYARVLANRWGKQLWGNDAPREQKPNAFKLLDKLQKQAAEAKTIRRVFVGSMMDIFEKPMHFLKEEGNTGAIRGFLFDAITRGEYPNLLFLLLTKRPSNINKYIPDKWKENPPANVMFGATAVNQATFDMVLRQLADVKGKKFLSIEPQLEYIDPDTLLEDLANKPDWIIQGGESGHHKRPFNLEWAYEMSRACDFYGIPYFFKQIDKVQAIPEGLQIRQFPKL